MPDSPLPYQDTKPVGAADFYFAINATFRFIQQRLGVAGLQRYWQQLGAQYHAPVSARWQLGGLAEVERYWRAFFAAEPGAKVEITRDAEAVTLRVKQCPALRHLREHGREVLPSFCQHCYFISDAMAAPAGLAARVCGGDGACVQRFMLRAPGLAEQSLSDIKEVTASC